MSQTITGSLRLLIVNAGLPGVEDKAYLDFAPADTIPPYVTYNDQVSMSPSVLGDGRVIEYSRALQVNLWQHEDHEDPQLPSLLLQALDGSLVTVEGMDGSRKVRVDSLTRLPSDLDEELVHHELTLTVVHPPNIA